VTGAARRLRLTLQLAASEVPTAEALLTLAGAETISLHDAADDPVLEPTPRTTPLWPHVRLHALFAAEADLEPLRHMLATSFPAGGAAIDVVPEAAWRGALFGSVRARPIGTRLWLAPAADAAGPPSRTVVRIHMGLAFGTGEHPTTALCLEWLDARAATGSTMLDYGCGSGILAIAALKLGARIAYAVDTEAQALQATRDNAALNGVADRLIALAPEDLPAVEVDVLTANILAGPLIELAPTFAQHLRPGGNLVLSGILEPQAAAVAKAYAAQFADFAPMTRDGWVRLTATRKRVKLGQNR
jgi:ribosomal protein L11 methyltransferase